MSAGNWRIFLFSKAHIKCAPFYFSTQGNIDMQLTLIKNTDASKSIEYKIARVVFAETQARSLRAVEALTSMIQNLSAASGLTPNQIVTDKNLFESLNKLSPTHKYFQTEPTNKGFQMCLRTVKRMLHGALPDCCYGATRFHTDEHIPEWAMSRGYIADIDGLLFYL